LAHVKGLIWPFNNKKTTEEEKKAAKSIIVGSYDLQKIKEFERKI